MKRARGCLWLLNFSRQQQRRGGVCRERVARERKNEDPKCKMLCALLREGRRRRRKKEQQQRWCSRMELWIMQKSSNCSRQKCVYWGGERGDESLWSEAKLLVGCVCVFFSGKGVIRGCVRGAWCEFWILYKRGFQFVNGMGVVFAWVRQEELLTCFIKAHILNLFYFWIISKSYKCLITLKTNCINNNIAC